MYEMSDMSPHVTLSGVVNTVDESIQITGVTVCMFCCRVYVCVRCGGVLFPTVVCGLDGTHPSVQRAK